MKTFLTAITLTIAAPAAMAQDMATEKVRATSLVNYFGKTCLKYAPNVNSIAIWKDTLGLTEINSEPLNFFELVYGLNVTNGKSQTLMGQTKQGVGIEIHLNEFTQDGFSYYGCSVGSPEVTSAATEAELRATYGLPGDPVLDEKQSTLHHRMWNLGSEQDPQYFILIGNSNPDKPTAVVSNFGKRY